MKKDLYNGRVFLQIHKQTKPYFVSLREALEKLMARQNKRNAFGLYAVISMQIYCPFPPWDFLYSTDPAEMVIFCGCSVWIPQLEYCLYLTILVSWSYLFGNLINFLLCIYLLMLTQTLKDFQWYLWNICLYWIWFCIMIIHSKFYDTFDCYEIISNFSGNKLLFQCFDIQSRHISWYHLGGCKPGFPVKCIRIKVSTFYLLLSVHNTVL